MSLFPPKFSWRIAPMFLLVGVAFCRPTSAADALGDGFARPPASARPWVYWYFMDGNLSREGITADLEAMRQAGISGAIFLEVNLGLPRGPVDFMSPDWEDLFVHAVREADRLGIQIALGAGPGWCGTGGPWITPDRAMQHLVASETNVAGPMKLTARLPRPQPRKPYFGEATLTPELKQTWREFYRDTAVVAFPTPEAGPRLKDVDQKALYFREPYSSKPGVPACLPEPAEVPSVPAGVAIDGAQVVDLTSRLAPDGTLTWDVPLGRWTIMRFGRTLTGQTTRPAPRPGLGLESDKFDRAALDEHVAAFVDKILARIGPRPHLDTGLTMLHFDSWEMSSQNWSPNFREEFRQRRGYDPLRWLPALTGRVVDSPEQSERFLWDLRQTAQELVVANHVGYLADLAHQRGLTLSVEPYDLNPCADLTLGRVADVPQGEFWYRGFNTSFSVIEAASIAHTGGRSLVAAEAFTAAPGEDWKADPAALKPLGDWAFCAGINRFDFHRYQHQPWTNRWPGMTMGPYGVHWERTQTWWDLVPAYHDYLARCQFLLQRGVPVADVCFLAAEGAPQVFRAPASATTGSPPDHTGYAFDGCAPETLLERASVTAGRLAFPDGMSYRVLVLPERRTMTPGLLAKLAALVRGGVTVIGPRPVKSPSLSGYPECDTVVKQLAAEVWGDCDGQSVFEHACGKGRVLWRETPVAAGEQYGDFAAVTNALNAADVPPDFEADGPVRFIHRRDGNAEIYFVANRASEAITARCQFRVVGRQPELWDPQTGVARDLPDFSTNATHTTVPLRFEPAQSWFVVFRRAGTPAITNAPNFPELRRTVELTGSWDVAFDPRWGGPASVQFESLADWSQRPESGIRYYSGRAVYRKTFDWTPASAAGTEVWLDLGNVKNLARVRVNGQEIGVLWCAPWRLAISRALQHGANTLEIEVANLWPNRLIGDARLPAAQRLTWTTLNPYRADSPLLPSGLLGPVTLLTSEKTAAEKKVLPETPGKEKTPLPGAK